MPSRANFARLTQQEAAELAGVSPRTVRDWPDCPRNDDGSYNGPAVVKWLIERATAGDEYSDQRQRLAAAQAEKVETENAIRRGQIADLGEVRRFWESCIANARARFLATPAKLGSQLVNISDAAIIAARIRAEINAALLELAEYQADAGSNSGSDAGGVQGLVAAAGSNGQPMGRRKSAAE